MADNYVTSVGTGGSTFASDEISSVQYPRVKTSWGVDGVAVDTSGTNPFPTSKNATIFQFSTNNTSTAQLAAAASFAGTIETALDQPCISLLLTSDQPITLTVKQYIDIGGTRAVPDIVFYIGAGLGFSRSFTLNGNYVQVTATNTGASTTTTFSLNTAYGDLGDSESGGVQPVIELPLVLTGASAQTVVVNNILNPTSGTTGLSVAGYRAASVQVISTGTGGTFIFEQSNDNTNWVALPIFNAALVTGVPITAAITATSSTIIYTFPLRCVYLRLRIATTITGGSIQAFTRIGTDPWTASAQLVASNTAANLAATVSGTVTATVTGGTTLPVTPTQTFTNSAATTNATSTKASAGTVWSVVATNVNAAARYLKMYNKASAPTVGTDVPVLTITLPASQSVTIHGGSNGIRFGTGIAWALTTGSADSDTAAVAVNEIKVAIAYT